MFQQATTAENPRFMNSYQKRAADSYKSASHHGLNDREAMAEACRFLINNLTLARDAYSSRGLDAMLKLNLKTLKILDVLREELAASDALNDPEAMPSAKFLLYTYRSIILRLTDILSRPSPVEEYNTLIEMMQPVYKAWQPPARRTTDTPPEGTIATA